MPRPTRGGLRNVPRQVGDFSVLAGGAHARVGGGRSRQGRPCVSASVPLPAKSLNHLNATVAPCPPLPLHHGVGREGVMTTPSLLTPSYKKSASAPSSAWAPLVPRKLLPLQPPALTPQRWAVPTLHLLPPRGSPEPCKRCLLGHCPQPRAHTPAGQARRLPCYKIPGGGAPEHQQAPVPPPPGHRPRADREGAR
ncbi:hypothetical protein HJG60_009878 [Phyllostomus discolor]|uniref:Uncharacterized protein n=1 Tax=Phyllostomus discolor TaxID=89673 RepID=A0A834BCU9_9CHIR|nr:hypothetical protein HJG60_009878 [Phyllostomus discolor]